jgi:pyruvate dehydrogenase E2 component (dihydrolipoamide acetyltransferase)
MGHIDILMPALSPTMEEGTLAKWLVKTGDKVRSGDVIAEIETDKATMEVEASDEGFVTEILVAEGEEGVKVNTPIARLASEATAEVPPPTPLPPARVEEALPPASVSAGQTVSEAPILSPAAKRIAAEQGLVRSDLRGTGRDGRVTKGDALAAVATRVLASPLAHRLAEQKGVDLSQLKGSGPNGRIIKADLEAAAPGARSLRAPEPLSIAQVRPAPEPAAAHPQSLEQMGIATGSYELMPLDAMRKVVARRMTESFRDTPHFPLTVDIELDALLAARARINALLKTQGVKVSINDFVIKAAAIALKRVPDANASYTPDGLAMHRHADIAVAVAVTGGLITPIVRRAEAKGLAEIAKEAKELAERARAKKLTPDEYQGGTFSISNLGMFGMKSFSSILNGPQGCILSVGAAEKRAVVRDDQLAVATVMTVTLTCDHRVVDGAVGAKWLQAFTSLLTDPLNLII